VVPGETSRASLVVERGIVFRKALTDDMDCTTCGDREYDGKLTRLV
jgi:hypothetical protein